MYEIWLGNGKPFKNGNWNTQHIPVSFCFWNYIFWLYKAFISISQVSLFGKLCNKNMIKDLSTKNILAAFLPQFFLVGIVSTG